MIDTLKINFTSRPHPIITRPSIPHPNPLQSNYNLSSFYSSILSSRSLLLLFIHLKSLYSSSFICISNHIIQHNLRILNNLRV